MEIRYIVPETMKFFRCEIPPYQMELPFDPPVYGYMAFLISYGDRIDFCGGTQLVRGKAVNLDL